jgi:hypothetical protein
MARKDREVIYGDEEKLVIACFFEVVILLRDDQDQSRSAAVMVR